MPSSIKLLIASIAFLISCPIAFPVTANAAIPEEIKFFFVSSTDGDDAYDGLASQWDGVHGPIRTLGRISTLAFHPYGGNVIQLKRGDTWEGQQIAINWQDQQEGMLNKLTTYNWSHPDRPKIIRNCISQDVCADTEVAISFTNPSNWSVSGIEFRNVYRGISVEFSVGGNREFSVSDCKFVNNDSRLDEPTPGIWPTPTATGINVIGLDNVCAPGDGPCHDRHLLDGFTVERCTFERMGQAIGLNTYGGTHNDLSNQYRVADVNIIDCVMQDGKFIQLAITGADGGLIVNTKIFNNGAYTTAGPAGAVIYWSNNFLIQDSEIACNRRAGSPIDGDGLEIQQFHNSIFRRVLFHHNDEPAIVVNSWSSNLRFENCVFAADDMDDNTPQELDEFGEIRLHQDMSAVFDGCRFLPAVRKVADYPLATVPLKDIPIVNGDQGKWWPANITMMNSTTRDVSEEVLGANLAEQASSSSQNASTRTWQHDFANPINANTVVLGQSPNANVRRFVIQYRDSATGIWRDAYSYNGVAIGTAAGYAAAYNTYAAFPAKVTTGIRIQVLDADAPIGLSTFGVHFATPLHTEDFRSCLLNTDWTWVRKNAAHYTLYDRVGFLRIATAGQELWGGGGNTENILLRSQPSVDWDARVRLYFEPGSNYQQAGLILYKDDDNYVKVVYGHDSNYPNGTAVEFTSEIGPVPTINQEKTGANSSYIYLRLVKSRSTYTGYWSLDGITWSQTGQFSDNDTDPSLSSARIGLLAQGTAGGYADFDWFDVTATPRLEILPPPPLSLD